MAPQSPSSGPRLTPRARARLDTLERIRELAWRQVQEHGAPALSLRAIARDLGVVSSAVYRYYDSRDALLTALIVEAYGDLATHLGDASGAHHDGADPEEQWSHLCTALRAWALGKPHRFLLIYGTPVPGYAAPADTVELAARVMTPFLRIAAQSSLPGAAPLSTRLEAQAAALIDGLAVPLPAERAVAAVGAISQLFGVLILELGGHFVGTFEPADALFEHLAATRPGT